MATTTPNFGWSVPTSSDLVKNGATAIETLGDSIDASLVDLKGGTTGQVLAKASNTDMDFVWAADAGAPTSLGFAAGKNKIINGDFGIWQRGTSFSPVADAGTFTADRFIFQRNGSGYTATCSRQTFTAGTAPVSGYEGVYFWRYNVTTAGTSNTYAVLDQRIENVQTLAGQTATISFWAKADAARTVTLDVTQEFGSGGSGQVGTSGGSHSVTTSWTRFTATVSVPSISGKTIGTGSYLIIRFGFPTGVTETIDIWGVQIEAGSTATAFQTATGTIQGELAACQRYYSKSYPQSVFADGVSVTEGTAQSFAATTSALFNATPFPVTMRTAPTVNIYAGAGGSGSGSVRNNSAGPVITGISVVTISQTSFTNLNKTGAFTLGNGYGFEYTASAEL